MGHCTAITGKVADKEYVVSVFYDGRFRQLIGESVIAANEQDARSIMLGVHGMFEYKGREYTKKITRSDRLRFRSITKKEFQKLLAKSRASVLKSWPYR